MKERGLLDKERFTLFPTLIHPKSRGSITLRSTDPFDHPVIDPNYLSHPDDVTTLIRGVLSCILYNLLMLLILEFIKIILHALCYISI